MSSRPNRILALVVAGLVVLAVVAAVVAATRSTPQYDRDSPEGVVQAYLTAVIDGDSAAALGYLDDDGCTVEDLDRAYLPDRTSVVLRDTDVTGDSATVEVEIVTSSGNVLEPEYSEEQTFRLTRTSGDWRILGQPWPMYECGLEY